MAYLDKDAFANLTVMPLSRVNAIESASPGWINAQLEQESAFIDSRLRKRYAVPFTTPIPAAVTGWLARLVTVRCYLRGGVDPTDLQFDELKEDARLAKEEIAEAADAVNGLFDLPLRSDTTATGIAHTGPFGYSEQSPYVWASRQRATGRSEDRNGGGSYG